MADFQVGRAPSLSRSTAGFVVVASVSGRYVEMAGSAAAIWAMLPPPDQPMISFLGLVAALVAAHGVTAEVAARDAAAVLESLEAIGCAVRFT